MKKLVVSRCSNAARRAVPRCVAALGVWALLTVSAQAADFTWKFGSEYWKGDVLDADLARIYGVATKVLNQAVKRNRERFPEDFIFQLTQEETEQYGHSRAQIVTGSQKHRDPKFPPYAFPEHGAIMAATVLNSPRAVQMSVFVVRAFIKMREQLLHRSEMEKRLAEIEKGLMSHDAALRDLYAKIRPLLLAPPDPPKKPIGFSVRESRARYQVRMRKGE